MIAINLGGKEYFASCPNLKAMKFLQGGLNALNTELYRLDRLKEKTSAELEALILEKGVDILNISQVAIQGACDYLFHSIQRNHPEFTPEILEESIDQPTLLNLYGQLMAMLNMPKVEDDSQLGESSGTTSSPKQPVLQDGAGEASSATSALSNSSDSTKLGKNSPL